MIKFLIIRFSSIGDIVLTTPVIRTISKQIPNSEVHFVTKKQFSSVVSTNPYIHKVHILDQSFSDLIKELKQENFDYIIDLHHNLRSFRIKFALQKIFYSFNKLNLEKWLLVNFKINRMPAVHIVDRYLETLNSFTISNDQQGLDFFIPQNDKVSIDTLPIQFTNGYIALVVGAGHETKQLTAEKLIQLCKLINYPIILLGGKSEIDKGEFISKHSETNVLNACGKYNLNQSASIVEQAKLVISHDTGLMHIAAALKKKIISIWGNTVPEFGMYPYFPHPDSKIIEVKGLPCRPCSKIGYSKCPKQHFKCINNINIEEISKIIYTFNK